MVATDRVREIFADAQALYQDALAMLEQDRLRNAAEKAWGATKRASDALILERTGEEFESRRSLPESCVDWAARTLELKGWSSVITHEWGPCTENASISDCATPQTQRNS